MISEKCFCGQLCSDLPVTHSDIKVVRNKVEYQKCVRKGEMLIFWRGIKNKRHRTQLIFRLLLDNSVLSFPVSNLHVIRDDCLSLQTTDYYAAFSFRLSTIIIFRLTHTTFCICCPWSQSLYTSLVYPMLITSFHRVIF